MINRYLMNGSFVDQVARLNDGGLAKIVALGSST